MPSPALHPTAPLALGPRPSPQAGRQARQDFRQHGSLQAADRLPRWLHRVWAWF